MDHDDPDNGNKRENKSARSQKTAKTVHLEHRPQAPFSSSALTKSSSPSSSSSSSSSSKPPPPTAPSNLASRAILACVQHKRIHTSSLPHSPQVPKEKCRKAMNSLKSVIPRIEQVSNISVWELCKLYTSILERSFCTYSLVIFDGGKLECFLPRVYKLLVMFMDQTAHESNNRDAGDTSVPSPPAPSETIKSLSHTISHTLSVFYDKLSTPNDQGLLLSDLITLSRDIGSVINLKPRPVFPAPLDRDRDGEPVKYPYIKVFTLSNNANTGADDMRITIKSSLSLFLLHKGLHMTLDLIFTRMLQKENDRVNSPVMPGFCLRDDDCRVLVGVLVSGLTHPPSLPACYTKNALRDSSLSSSSATSPSSSQNTTHYAQQSSYITLLTLLHTLLPIIPDNARAQIVKTVAEACKNHVDYTVRLSSLASCDGRFRDGDEEEMEGVREFSEGTARLLTVLIRDCVMSGLSLSSNSFSSSSSSSITTENKGYFPIDDLLDAVVSFESVLNDTASASTAATEGSSSSSLTLQNRILFKTVLTTLHQILISPLQLTQSSSVSQQQHHLRESCVRNRRAVSSLFALLKDASYVSLASSILGVVMDDDGIVDQVCVVFDFDTIDGSVSGVSGDGDDSMDFKGKGNGNSDATLPMSANKRMKLSFTTQTPINYNTQTDTLNASFSSSSSNPSKNATIPSIHPSQTLQTTLSSSLALADLYNTTYTATATSNNGSKELLSVIVTAKVHELAGTTRFLVALIRARSSSSSSVSSSSSTLLQILDTYITALTKLSKSLSLGCALTGDNAVIGHRRIRKVLAAVVNVGLSVVCGFCWYGKGYDGSGVCSGCFDANVDEYNHADIDVDENGETLDLNLESRYNSDMEVMATAVGECWKEGSCLLPVAKNDARAFEYSSANYGSGDEGVEETGTGVEPINVNGNNGNVMSMSMSGSTPNVHTPITPSPSSKQYNYHANANAHASHCDSTCALISDYFDVINNCSSPSSPTSPSTSTCTCKHTSHNPSTFPHLLDTLLPLTLKALLFQTSTTPNKTFYSTFVKQTWSNPSLLSSGLTCMPLYYLRYLQEKDKDDDEHKGRGERKHDRTFRDLMHVFSPANSLVVFSHECPRVRRAAVEAFGMVGFIERSRSLPSSSSPSSSSSSSSPSTVSSISSFFTYISKYSDPSAAQGSGFADEVHTREYLYIFSYFKDTVLPRIQKPSYPLKTEGSGGVNGSSSRSFGSSSSSAMTAIVYEPARIRIEIYKAAVHAIQAFDYTNLKALCVNERHTIAATTSSSSSTLSSDHHHQQQQQRPLKNTVSLLSLILTVFNDDDESVRAYAGETVGRAVAWNNFALLCSLFGPDEQAERMGMMVGHVKAHIKSVELLAGLDALFVEPVTPTVDVFEHAEDIFLHVLDVHVDRHFAVHGVRVFMQTQTQGSSVSGSVSCSAGAGVPAANASASACASGVASNVSSATPRKNRSSHQHSSNTNKNTNTSTGSTSGSTSCTDQDHLMSLNDSTAPPSNSIANNENRAARIQQLKVLKLYGSLAMHAPVFTHPGGILLLQSVLPRILTFYVSPDTEYLALDVLSELHAAFDFRRLMNDEETMGKLIASVFRVLMSANDDSGTTNFYYLNSFLTMFVVGGHSSGFSSSSNLSSSSSSSSDYLIFKYINDHWPVLMKDFTIDFDITSIHRLVSYNHIMTTLVKSSEFASFSVQDTFDDFSLFCGINPKFIGPVIVRLLRDMNKQKISFYLQHVCKNHFTMQELIISGTQPILSLLFDEIGVYENQEEIMSAIKYGATWHELRRDRLSGNSQALPLTSASVASAAGSSNSAASVATDVNFRPLEGVEAILNLNTGGTEQERMDAARRWLKPQVMYLLVNLVGKNLSTKTMPKKRQALRSMLGVVRFMIPSEAAQYLPKIMSIVNIAMSDERGDPELRLLTVMCLSDFVRMLCECNKVNVVGSNISTIVVVLFPLLQDDHVTVTPSPSSSSSSSSERQHSLASMGVTYAVNLLEYLVTDTVGKAMYPYLQGIPFLPSNPQLESVRASLRATGVDLDELTNHNQDRVADGSDDGRLQLILQRRLRALGALMKHESVNVRKVVLQHLTLILKANRPVFRKLVEAEQMATMRFLTVTKQQKAQSSGARSSVGSAQQQHNHHNISSDDFSELGTAQSLKGGVSLLVHTLLLRCSIEDNPSVKLALAVCLGELGAIDPNKIGAISTILDRGSGSASGGGDGSDALERLWRLGQPPWQSQMLKYAHKLLVNRLVVALKAASSAQDQDKIGFAIQEVLRLLSDSSEGNNNNNNNDGSEESSKSNNNNNAVSFAGAPTPRKTAAMSDWLKNTLTEEGLFFIVEPFWNTYFYQMDVNTNYHPPFFTDGMRYQTWISRWCRHLTTRSGENPRSPWKKLFVSCRSATRTAAGISVAEFLLPLLVLDAACFGEKREEEMVICEMERVLKGHSSSAASSASGSRNDAENNNENENDNAKAALNSSKRYLNFGDEHRRAVNIVFMVLDTLESWAEKETEDKIGSERGERGGGNRKSRHQEPASTTNDGLSSWPSEEGVDRIQAILSRITLETRAEAATAVGAHARALRYLEMDMRSLRVSDYQSSDLVSPKGPRLTSHSNSGAHAHADGSNSGGEVRVTGLGGSLNPITVRSNGKFQRLMGCLNDVDSMIAIAQAGNKYREFLLEEIFQREVCGDWSKALIGYEQAIILNSSKALEANEVNEDENENERQEGNGNTVSNGNGNSNGAGVNGAGADNFVDLSIDMADADGDGDAEEESEVTEVSEVDDGGYEPTDEVNRNASAADTSNSRQIKPRHNLERGLLNSLLQLGQLESVLNQVGGMLNRNEEREITDPSLSSDAAQELLPSAVEAAWRLQRWPLLEDLLYQQGGGDGNLREEGGGELDAGSRYQVSLGKAMLALHHKDQGSVKFAVDEARLALMGDVGNAARESYTRTYPILLKFQALREIDYAAPILCSSCEATKNKFYELANADKEDGFDWENRLALTSSKTGIGGIATIVNVRLSLAKLANEVSLEGDLWLSTAKRARKAQLFNIAEPAIAQARAAYAGVHRKGRPSQLNAADFQLAKLKHALNCSGEALRMLEPYDGRLDVKLLLRKDNTILQNMTQDKLDDLGSRLLLSTQWTVESGLKFGAEIKERYELLLKVTPQWEKSHYYYARYLDVLLESRLAALMGTNKGLDSLLEARRADLKGSNNSSGSKGAAESVIITEDEKRSYHLKNDDSCIRYLLEAVKQYGEALKLGDKHLYRALPRLLTLWFEFTSLDYFRTAHSVKDRNGNKIGGKKKNKGSVDTSAASSEKDDEFDGWETMEDKRLFDNQNTINIKIVQSLMKNCPPHVFYTAMPQLISRVCHEESNTAKLVHLILRKVLSKYPCQAMWALVWLKQSNTNERKAIGERLFVDSMKDLTRKSETKMHDLLEEAKGLFEYLRNIAMYPNEKIQGKTIIVKPWRSKSVNVKLSDFVPPIQAALSVSLAVSLSESERLVRMNGESADVFPSYIPRMRAFSSNVEVMNSKAKPKKITAYAVAGGRTAENNDNTRADEVGSELGEMHFLVKREEKGDLRKDARVQDLNNVINRLLSVSVGGGNGGGNNKRKLCLRTFSVTCLSEDCGILEWVPDTQSLRQTVKMSYNPQAPAHSERRRGRHTSDLTDPKLKTNFIAAQDMYLINNNLPKAVEMFERLCLKKHPPVLYWYFVQKFSEPHDWFEARRRFTLSSAAWSAVGHVIGLGDRHSENILVDTSTGDVVHVDFDCLFDKGLKLARPEVVPFRLTQNMVDAMGPCGYEGVFRGGMVECMRTLREQREVLVSVLEPFLRDPVIAWKDDMNVAARRSMNIIEGRLKGVYNLRNPNHEKIRQKERAGGGGGGEGDDDDSAMIIPLPVEGQVNKLISEATSSEKLLSMYYGWASMI